MTWGKGCGYLGENMRGGRIENEDCFGIPPLTSWTLPKYVELQTQDNVQHSEPFTQELSRKQYPTAKVRH